MRILTI